MAEDEQRHRLVVLGDGHVGKSSIIRRLLTGEFSDAYKATVEDLHCRDYRVGGATIKVDILDTAGDLVFPAMRRLSISTAHAFLLVYAVDNRDSFDEVRRIWDQIKEQRSPTFRELPCVVIGNKTDATARRVVAAEEVRAWAEREELDADEALMEVSAKEGADGDVLNIFYRLLSQANGRGRSPPGLLAVEPLIRRQLSGNAAQMAPHRLRLRDTAAAAAAKDEGRVSRSRSLMRRVQKPKVKQTPESASGGRNDCSIS